MPTKKTDKWPKIMEKKQSGKENKGTRKFTIKDARNTWEIVVINNEEMVFEINNFGQFYFKLEEDSLHCYKKIVTRKTDSGELSCFDERYNLIDDSGERRTLRLKNLKLYMREIFN